MRSRAVVPRRSRIRLLLIGGSTSAVLPIRASIAFLRVIVWRQSDMGLDAMIRRLGGLVTAAELEARGLHPQVLSMAAYSKKVIRVRKGWYSIADVPQDVRDACAVGGRLGCVSALAHHGLAEPPNELHVALHRSASRLRLDPTRIVVLHWSRAELTGDRHAVSVEQARQQAVRCARSSRRGDDASPTDNL
ncbi:MAG: hypothetical protein EPN91_00370 [Salinibacterium sp.]|nr:MAG: hypothetical protein EPN91_00370 [Salinibacterium sp.]